MAAALAMAATAARGCDGLVDGPQGAVTSVIDGDTIALDTGMVVRLTGIQAPRLAKGRDGLTDWPLAETARKALADLVVGKPVRLAYGGTRSDRYGRALAQVFSIDPHPVWLQQAMLSAGLARVYSFPDNFACLKELRAAEATARAEGKGLWADPFYAIRRADQPQGFAALAGRYELVEGRVVSVAARAGRTYVDFGRQWRDDFTAVIDAAALRRFKTDGIDPAGLAGALVRVRGWIELRDGPLIEVTHPAQIEVLARP